jgi:hypothetical protein
MILPLLIITLDLAGLLQFQFTLQPCHGSSNSYDDEDNGEDNKDERRIQILIPTRIVNNEGTISN